MESKDYYKILGINKNASIDEIKKAYRSLAIKWHPDKNKDPIALKKFKEINESYQILSDIQKRQEYDSFKFNKNDYNFGNFVKKDPFEIFNEFFSIINGIQNTMKIFDNFFNVQNQGVTIHIVDISSMSDMGMPIRNPFNPDHRNPLKIMNDKIQPNMIRNKMLPSKNDKDKKWIGDIDNGYMLNDQDLNKILEKIKNY